MADITRQHLNQTSQLKLASKERLDQMRREARHILSGLDEHWPTQVNELRIRMAFAKNQDDAAPIYDLIMDLQAHNRRAFPES